MNGHPRPSYWGNLGDISKALKSFFSPREKKAKAIILQLPSILPACLWGGRNPGRGVGKALGKMTPAGMHWNGWCPGDMGGTIRFKYIEKRRVKSK